MGKEELWIIVAILVVIGIFVSVLDEWGEDD